MREATKTREIQSDRGRAQGLSAGSFEAEWSWSEISKPNEHKTSKGDVLVLFLTSKTSLSLLVLLEISSDIATTLKSVADSC